MCHKKETEAFCILLANFQKTKTTTQKSIRLEKYIDRSCLSSYMINEVNELLDS